VTAVLVPAGPRAAAAPGVTAKVTQRRVLLSEWTKFRSLRSTVWTLLVAAILMVGISALFSAVVADKYDTFSPSDLAQFNPIGTSLQGVSFAQLAIGVLGVLLVTGEYSTGMIKASLTVVPRRLPVLWAKLAVFAGTVFSMSLITSFISFFLGQALMSSKHI
jgi:ABC-2 type transport system permease protein